MLLPASYANGFAPRDGRPLYPELWRGCVGAWNPGLGVSGLTLRDQSGFQNNGVLTNGPTWAASQGKYAMSMNIAVANQYVTATGRGTTTAESTLAMWLQLSAYSTYGSIPFHADANYWVQLATNGTMIYTGGPNFTIPSTAWTDGLWRHLAFVVKSDGTKVYINGLQAGSDATKIPGTIDATEIWIGRYRGGDFWSHKGQLDDVMTYRRPLSPQEIRTLATRRGIAYEMAPRRRSSSAVTTNRRRRIIIGGNR